MCRGSPAVVAVLRGGDHAARRIVADRALPRLRQVLAGSLQALRPWSGDVAQLGALVLPDLAAFERFSKAREEARDRIDREAADIERLSGERQRLMAAVDALGTIAGVVGEREAAAIRAAREARLGGASPDTRDRFGRQFRGSLAARRPRDECAFGARRGCGEASANQFDPRRRRGRSGASQRRYRGGRAPATQRPAEDRCCFGACRATAAGRHRRTATRLLDGATKGGPRRRGGRARGRARSDPCRGPIRVRRATGSSRPLAWRPAFHTIPRRASNASSRRRPASGSRSRGWAAGRCARRARSGGSLTRIGNDD